MAANEYEGELIMEIKNKNNVRPYDDIQLDRKDIEAVASSRFFRRAGMKILLLWAFFTLLIVSVYNYFEPFPLFIAYLLLAADAIIFVYLYSKKSTEIRTKLLINMDKHMLEQRQKEQENK